MNNLTAMALDTLDDVDLRQECNRLRHQIEAIDNYVPEVPATEALQAARMRTRQRYAARWYIAMRLLQQRGASLSPVVLETAP